MIYTNATVLTSYAEQVYNLVNPIASIKKLSTSMNPTSSLPDSTIGHDKNLMQTILKMC